MFALSMYYLLFFAVLGIYVIFFPSYFKSLGFSTGEIGILLAFTPIMRFLTPFFNIKITKKVYTLSVIVGFLATFLLFSHNFYILALAFILFGICWSISYPYIEALAVERLGIHYGKSRLWGSIGFMAIGLIFSYTNYTDYTTAYLVLTLIMSFIALIFILDSNLSIQKEFHPVSIKGHWKFWIALFLMQFSFQGFYNFFTIENQNQGISNTTISWLWSIGVIFEIGIFIFQHKFINSFKPLFWIKISIFLTAIRWLVLYFFIGNVYLTALSQTIHAFSFALFHTSALLYISQNYKNKTLAQQFYAGIAYGLAGFLGSFVSGFLGEYLFLVEGIIAFVGFIILAL
jgi:PPP family 3-phenylpropionic acid transporter